MIHWRASLEKPSVLLRAGQRDVHDRQVEHDHQLRDADQRQDQPAALVMREVGDIGLLAGSGGMISLFDGSN